MQSQGKLDNKYNIMHLQKVSSSVGVQIQFDGCGQTHGCFLYPAYCTDWNCDVGVTYRDEGNRTRFQIFAKQVEGYVSVGFSEDRWMVGILA